MNITAKQKKTDEKQKTKIQKDENMNIIADKTVVLYDIENIRERQDFENVLLKIDEILQGKKPLRALAYTDWSIERSKQFKDLVCKKGIHEVQVSRYGRGLEKNASDIALAVDAVEILTTDDDIENFIIVSGDGGFVSLVKKIHERKKKAIIVSMDRQLASAVIGYAHAVHIVEKEDAKKIETDKTDRNIPSDLLDEIPSEQVKGRSGIVVRRIKKDTSSQSTSSSSKFSQIEDYVHAVREISQNEPVLTKAISEILKNKDVVAKIKSDGLSVALLVRFLTEAGHKKSSAISNIQNTIGLKRSMYLEEDRSSHKHGVIRSVLKTY